MASCFPGSNAVLSVFLLFARSRAPKGSRRSADAAGSRRRLAVLGGALLLWPAGAAFATPFTNGGFETSALTPWYQSVSASTGEDWNVTTADAHSGTYSATDTGNKEIRQDFDGILTDDITELSFWLRHPDLDLDTGSIPLAFDLYYDDNTFEQFTVYTNSQDWEFFDVTSYLISGKMLSGFGVFGYVFGCGVDFCSGRTYLDDVTIAAVPEPSAAALLGLGLVALAGRRSRRAR